MKIFKRNIGYHLLWMCLFFVNCDLERKNPLDPKNPNSNRPVVVVAELFINDDMGTAFCDYALEAVENLSQPYYEQLVVVEYHLPYRTSTDQFISQSFVPVYQDYVRPGEPQGLPHIFINGTSHQIQGASSVRTVQDRCEMAIITELDKKSYLTIEASLSKVSSNFNITGKIARLGDEDISNIEIKAVLIEDIQQAKHHFVARSLFTEQTISFIKHSEIKDFQLSTTASNFLREDLVRAVIFVQKIQNKQTLGAISIPLD